MSQLSFDLSGVAARAPERVVVCHGAQATEARLLEELRALADEARRDPALLARPVRVLVPSRSLREHVAARLAHAQGGLAGVTVQTLRGFARELLARAGEPDPGRGGEWLLPVLARRHAPEFEALRAVLHALDEGYAAVAESVRDLLDAGLDESNAESADEALAAAGGDAPCARARALVALALRVRRELSGRGLAPPGSVFVRAVELVSADPAHAAARAIWIHGYADATGLQLDLLEALVKRAGGRALLDHPPDPAAPGAPPAFTRRLRERLGAPDAPAAARAPAAPALLRASGAEGEARAVAERIRALLDRGLAPEAVAVVARDLQPYRFALATHLRRLGIPISGGPGFVGPEGRRARALLALLEEGARAPVDRWLDAADFARRSGDPEEIAPLELADLRVALHALGAARLAAVARLEPATLVDEHDRYRLPVRTRQVASEEDESEKGAEPTAWAGAQAPGLRRRSLSRSALEAARDAARATLGALEGLKSAPTLGEQLAALRALVRQALRWRRDTLGGSDLETALATLERELAPGLALDPPELRLLLRRALRDTGVRPLGGGGGVALRSVTEARAQSFAQLFVLGMNRDVFPRAVLEDPLLPDRLRRALEVVLPDVPIKSRGYAEERHLFAQLLSAADGVVLSWQEVSDDGKERPVSPLVARLRIALGSAAPAPALASGPWSEVGASPRPPLEHAVLAGLAGEPARAERALALALTPLVGADAAGAARARANALALHEELAPAGTLGPHFGLIGSALAGTSELSVSRLEGLYHCPWQTFLERVLGLAPPPDSLAELPTLDPLVLGNAVHHALEAIAVRAGVPSHIPLAEARTGRSVPWPDGAELRELAALGARRAARDAGIVLPGYAEMVERRALAFLASVGATDFPSGARTDVAGVEVEGAVELTLADQAPLRVTFRADRADWSAGRSRLTDYKTGAPISEVGALAKRREAFLEQIEDGRRLQAACYARAGDVGRYLFARPDLASPREWAVEAQDREVADALTHAVGLRIAQWRRGLFVPRLAEGENEGPACRNCRLGEACWKGEPGARRRVAEWQGGA